MLVLQYLTELCQRSGLGDVVSQISLWTLELESYNIGKGNINNL